MTELLFLVVGTAIGALGVYLVVLRSRSPRRSFSPPDASIVMPSTHTSLGPEAAQPPTLAPVPSTWDLLDHISEGVLILDKRLRPILANAAASRILGVQGNSLPTRLPSEEVAVVARRAQKEGSDTEDLLNLWYPRRSSIKARATPIAGSGEVLIVLQDVTEELLSQKIRTEFVAHASHELKSPVASLQTLAEAIQQASGNDPQTVDRFAHKMVMEAGRLARLITDLLDLSRLEEPADVPDEPTDLSSLARRQLAQVRSLAEMKEVQLSDEIQDAVWVRGDDQQLALMVRNLLENAIRYTPAGGTVRLEVISSGGDAVVRVVDTGIGIPLEAQGRVFERFFRVDSARSRDRGGTGLGLAIVKHVAELHGGEVSVQSELGRGSTFTARIPTIGTTPIASLTG